MPETVHFVGDPHFNHKKQAVKRGFLTQDMLELEAIGEVDPLTIRRGLQQMNELLIHRWNSVVPKRGRVYCLGDVFFGRVEWAVEICKRLNGTIYLIRGNHDKIAEHKLVAPRFEWIKDYARVKIGDQKIYLCHYAFRTWNCMHHGSWNLHGHSHGSLYEYPDKLQVDVGVDRWNGYPVSYEQLQAYMAKKRPFIPVDHHGLGDDE